MKRHLIWRIYIMGKEFESNGVNVEIPDELESVVALEYSL